MDLMRGDVVKADCAACHHVALLTPNFLPRLGLSSSAKIPDLKRRVRCRGCGARGRAVVSAKWGVRNQKLPYNVRRIRVQFRVPHRRHTTKMRAIRTDNPQGEHSNCVNRSQTSTEGKSMKYAEYFRKLARRCRVLSKTAADPELVEQARVWAVDFADEADKVERRAVDRDRYPVARSVRSSWARRPAEIRDQRKYATSGSRDDGKRRWHHHGS